MKDTGRTVASVAIISLLSRVLTLLSQTIYISHFGSTIEMDIFKYALTMPNTIFNSFGTALNLVVIPIYMAILSKGGKAKAKRFLDNIISIVSVLILGIIALGMVFAPAIGQLSNYKNTPESFAFLVYALRVLIPVMFFYGINYIFQGVLQSNGKFKLPAMVALPTSIITIIYTLFLGDRFGVKGLLFASLIGLSLQPLIMIPAIKRTGYKYEFSFEIKDPYIIKVAKQTLPVLISASAYQINTLFSTNMATRFGTVILMSFPQEIVIISVLTIIYSITGVYFPRLTKMWALDEKEDFKNTLSHIISLVIFLLIPAGAGFYILRYDIMNILINYKSISDGDVLISGTMLGIYGIAVIFVGLKEVLDRAFYSQHNTKTPAIGGFIIMSSNIIITYMLLNRFFEYSMPLAYLASACIGVIFLFIKINKKIKIINKEFFLLITKSLVSAGVMILVIWIEKKFIGEISIINVFVSRIIKVAIPVATGAFAYFISAYILKVDQANMFIDGGIGFIKNKFKKAD